jgi:hypothetical protein
MKLTKMNISAIKRTAQTVYPYKKKLISLKEKIAALQEEIQDIEFTIDSYEAPIKKMTGFTSSELVTRKATTTANIDKNGKPVVVVTWEFIGIPENNISSDIKEEYAGVENNISSDSNSSEDIDDVKFEYSELDSDNNDLY